MYCSIASSDIDMDTRISGKLTFLLEIQSSIICFLSPMQYCIAYAIHFRWHSNQLRDLHSSKQQQCCIFYPLDWIYFFIVWKFTQREDWKGNAMCTCSTSSKEKWLFCWLLNSIMPPVTLKFGCASFFLYRTKRINCQFYMQRRTGRKRLLLFIYSFQLLTLFFASTMTSLKKHSMLKRIKTISLNAIEYFWIWF